MKIQHNEPLPDIQANIDRMIEEQYLKAPDLSKSPFLSLFAFTALLGRLWWVTVIVDKGPGFVSLLADSLPSVGLPSATAEPTPPYPTESPAQPLPLAWPKKILPTCDIGLYTKSDISPGIAHIEKTTKRILRQGLSLTAIDAVDTVIDQFIDSELHGDESSAQTARYSDLSVSAKTKLHKKILQSILNPSYTLDEKTGKASGIKNDPLLESKENAKRFKKAYHQIIEIAENKEKLTLKKLDRLNNMLFSQGDQQQPGIRSQELFKVGFDVYYMAPADLPAMMNNLLQFIHTPITGISINIREAILSGVFLTAHPYIEANGRTSMLLTIYHSIWHDHLPPVYDFQGRPGLALHGVYTSIGPRLTSYLDENIKKTKKVEHAKKAPQFSHSVTIANGAFFSRGIFTQLHKQAPNRLAWQIPDQTQFFGFFKLQDQLKNSIIFNIKHNREAALKIISNPEPS